jgi:hypothetical protein
VKNGKDRFSFGRFFGDFGAGENGKQVAGFSMRHRLEDLE